MECIQQEKIISWRYIIPSEAINIHTVSLGEKEEEKQTAKVSFMVGYMGKQKWASGQTWYKQDVKEYAWESAWGRLDVREQLVLEMLSHLSWETCFFLGRLHSRDARFLVFFHFFISLFSWTLGRKGVFFFFFSWIFFFVGRVFLLIFFYTFRPFWQNF